VGHRTSWGSKSALTTTARGAKRENGGLGEDPPGSPMSHLQVLRICPDSAQSSHTYMVESILQSTWILNEQTVFLHTTDVPSLGGPSGTGKDV
jgi:hypothetical protein